MRDLFFSVIVSFFIILFVYQPVKVEGGSMEPGLEDQERIVINKLVYRLESIERGDIIVFRYPRDTRKSFIKRVIGLPGDHIRIAYGHVYVNDEQLSRALCPFRLSGCPVLFGHGGAQQLLLCAGRPSLHVQRQPRIRPGDAQLYLWQSRLRLLAHGEAGNPALNWRLRLFVAAFGSNQMSLRVATSLLLAPMFKRCVSSE